jgi:hypothetical protein
MNSPHPLGSHIRRKGDEGFGPGKGFLESPDKMERGKSKGLKEAFHSDLLLTDAGEKAEIIVRLVGIGVEADMKGFISQVLCFLNRLEHLLHSPEGHFFSARDPRLGWDVATAPGTLNRTASANGEVVDGRFEGIHPEVFLFGNARHIEGLPNITDIRFVMLE